ncbi:hypothetical protein AKO1_012948 [Acrasis kona]|uniref:Uncharacterized protein n=1 Tax=Acrasis kona TaxID=1008807 RepID=A0AAW2YZQ4_9EUKA
MTSNDDVDDFFNDMIAGDKKNTTLAKKLLQQQKHLESKPKEQISQPQQQISATQTITQLGTPQDVLQSIQKDVNSLSSEDRNVRRAGLLKIKSIIDTCAKNERVDVMAHVFSHIDHALVRLFNDQVEFLRESSCRLVITFVTHLTTEELGESYSTIVPAIHPRLTNKKEGEWWTESSEEVRMLLNSLLTLCVSKFPNALSHAHYSDNIVHILKSSYHDFHDIIKEACTCTITLCEKMPHKVHLFASILILAIKHNTSHNRSDVRVSTIRAIQRLMLHCRGQDVPLQEHIHPALHSMIMTEQSPSVRAAIIETAHVWIREWIEYFSFRHYILFYCMIGLSDELNDVRQESSKALLKAGDIYIKDNESEYQQMCEYERMHPIPQQDEALYVQHIGSLPPLQVRMLIRDVTHVKKCIDWLLEDLFDWNVYKRRNACRALTTLLLFTRQHITQHLHKLIPNYLLVCQEDEQDIKQECLSGFVQLSGRFVAPESYLTLVCSYLKPHYAASPQKMIDALVIMEYLLKGAGNENMNDASLQEIINQLVQSHLIHSDHLGVKLAVLSVVEVLSCLKCLNHVTGGELFKMFIVLQSNHAAQTTPRCLRALDSLAHASGHLHIHQLYKEHFDEALEFFLNDFETWNKTSVHLYSFQALLSHCPGECLVPHLHSQSKLAKVFLFHSNITLDPIVSLHVFAVMNNLLSNHGQLIINHQEFVKCVLSIISSHMVWKSGSVAAELRRIASACLSCLLRQGVVTGEMIKDLTPSIISALEEDTASVRAVTSVLIGDFIKSTCSYYDEKVWSDWTQVFTQQGLNDELDHVRLHVAKASLVLLNKMPSGQNRSMLLTALFVHIDDERQDVRQAVFDSLHEYGLSAKASGGAEWEEFASNLSKIRNKVIRAGELVRLLDINS